MENGTVWSNSSESSDDSSSPALAHQRLAASNVLQTTLTSQLSSTLHKSSASTPSLSSNQEEEETDSGEVFSQTESVPNGHLQTSCPLSPDCTVTDRASVQSADLAETAADLSCSCPDVSSVLERADASESCLPQVPVEELKRDPPEESVQDERDEAGMEHVTDAAERLRGGTSEEAESVQELKQPEEAPAVS